MTTVQTLLTYIERIIQHICTCMRWETRRQLYGFNTSLHTVPFSNENMPSSKLDSIEKRHSLVVRYRDPSLMVMKYEGGRETLPPYSSRIFEESMKVRQTVRTPTYTTHDYTVKSNITISKLAHTRLHGYKGVGNTDTLLTCYGSQMRTGPQNTNKRPSNGSKHKRVEDYPSSL